jgi:D-sedoheptulose 7-phosphate isomerase
LLLFGNGGSAADAQHIAGEFINRFLPQDRRALPALALSTDGGVLTCIANDTGFENIFARQVEALGVRGDVCLAITTSGNSPNVIAAIEQAHAKELKVIGLLGRDGGRCAELCDLALVVSSNDTQRIQETHNLIGHVVCELVEMILFPQDEQA